LLRANGAIISGSTALHFFLPDTSWHPHHLDIYIPANTFKRFMRTVTDHTTFGWVYAPRRRHTLARGSAPLLAAQLYEDLEENFRSLRTLRTPTGRRVNVVRSHANNPISPLRCFWSTLTMNFLTPDGCVCAFPSATLARQGAIK
ncbi:hypothetical protein OH76DRAFT_1308788, partial [Lentinus brumalis]